MFLFNPFRPFLLPSSEDPQAQKIYNLPENKIILNLVSQNFTH